MAKLRRTLLIGLGGTGFTAILNAKKMFYETYGDVPPMIGFLGIDTDAPGIQNASVTANDGTIISLNKSEVAPITVNEPATVYERNCQTNLFDWMPRHNVQGLTTLQKGAGQMRSNGRFAITTNEKNIEQIITRKLNEVNNASIIDNEDYDLLGADTEVHLVFSLGGGTGAGTFLNTAYLVRRLLPNARISGYAVLPDVFRAMQPGAGTVRVRPNGMGALADLDYLAHLDSNSTPVEIKWFHHIEKVNKRPFTALYLIDNRNADNDSFDNVLPICQMISLAIVTSVGQLGITMDSIADNVDKIISDGAMDVLDKKAWVAGFGCSEIFFDGSRLANIYARKACIQLVNKMLNGGCADPANIANNWFDTTHIRENQGKDDVIDYFMAPSPQYIFQDIDNPDNPGPDCQAYLNTRAIERQEKLTELQSALQDRVDQSLSELMNKQANGECGVFLCNEILHSILHQIELCDEEMKNEKEQFDDELPRLESRLSTACKELSDCMDSFFKLGRKDYEQEVMDATMAIAVNRRQSKRRALASEFYAWLRIRIGESISRVDIIWRNLESIRKDCNERIQSMLRASGSANFFQFDLAEKEAERVECPLSDIVFNDFVKHLAKTGGVPALSAMNSAEAELIFMNFANSMPKVKIYREKTVDNVLDEMTQEELDSVMQRALQKSLPLLPFTLRGYDANLLTSPEENYYIGVADKQKSRLAKQGYLETMVPNAKNINFSEIGLKNRIIIYRQLAVLPVFTLKSIDNYKNEYHSIESQKPHTSHWNTLLCDRMAQERYSIYPKVVNANVIDLWVKTIIFDLVSYNATRGKYMIRSRGMGGSPLHGWLVEMGSTRQEAFDYLEKNLDILEPEINDDLTQMDRPGPNNPVRTLAAKAYNSCFDGTYLTEVSKCPISADEISYYPAEEKLLEKEITYILDHYKQ